MMIIVGAYNNYLHYLGGGPCYSQSMVGPKNPILIIKAPR